MTPDEILTEVKSYLRIDGADDDAIVGLLIEAADAYLTNAGAERSDLPLYRLARMLYVGVHYDHRDGTDKSERFSHSLQGVILQLTAGR